MNMMLRKLGMALYDIEAAYHDKDNDELKHNIETAMSAYNDLKEDMKARNTFGLVELDDVYAFLKEMRDENMDELNVAMVGKEVAEKKWYYTENIIESMENWFVPVR